MDPARRIACVAVPPAMQALPRDARGFPIPAIVLRDAAGRPHFTINDNRKVVQALEEDRCTICWNRLTRGRWFLGGPLSALHPQGAYNDPPTHRECAHYALQVCPYLAAPHYAKRVADGRRVAQAGLGIGINPSSDTERPALFVLVMAVGQSVRWSALPTIRPRRPYRAVEYWQSGAPLADEVGRTLAARVLAESQPAPRVPRLIQATDAR